jgi:hypothetical protein
MEKACLLPEKWPRAWTKTTAVIFSEALVENGIGTGSISGSISSIVNTTSMVMVGYYLSSAWLKKQNAK